MTASAALDDATLARGRQIRLLLMNALDEVDQAGGAWPAQLRALDQFRSKLVYTPPGEIRFPRYIRPVTVVLHEPLAEHPGGVWVGYADGHVEFAPSADALASCTSQLPLLMPALEKYGDPFGKPPTEHVDPKGAAGRLKGTLTLRILDPDGKPVPGALVGVHSYFGDDADPDLRVFFYDQPKERPMVTDPGGRVIVTAARAFNPLGTGSTYLDLHMAPLYVLDERRGLVALEQMTLGEFDGRTRDIRLRPACKVSAELTGFALGDGAGNVGRVEGFAAKIGMQWLRAVFSISRGPHFELLVPPGEYRIYLGGSKCYPLDRYVHIDPGTRELRLFIDLPARPRPQELIGHPAPELRHIKEWKNGGPVTLAQLRGRVVLLDFWGYWCGPCVGSMPELMKLHDRYKDKGLVVLAVHDDSVESLREADEKLKRARAEVWGGRDLPFLIALDGGGETRIPGTGELARGATTAAWHVWSFPTTFLIARDGTVAREVRLYDPKALAQIDEQVEALLQSR